MVLAELVDRLLPSEAVRDFIGDRPVIFLGFIVWTPRHDDYVHGARHDKPGITIHTYTPHPERATRFDSLVAARAYVASRECADLEICALFEMPDSYFVQGRWS